MSHLQHKLPASFSLNPGRRNPPAALKVALPSGAIFNRAAHNVSASLERTSLPVRRPPQRDRLYLGPRDALHQQKDKPNLAASFFESANLPI